MTTPGGKSPAPAPADKAPVTPVGPQATATLHRWQRIGLAALLAAVLCWAAPALAGAAPASARAGPVVQVTYPELSVNGNLDFFRIGWQPGDQVHGTLRVQVTRPVRNLAIVAGGGATSLSPWSRNVIPKDGITLRLANPPGFPTAAGQGISSPGSSGPGTAGQSAAAGPWSGVLPPGHYQFALLIDRIPGPDTYLTAPLRVTGEYLESDRPETWAPLDETLVPIKIKAFGDMAVRVTSGITLTQQWTNLRPPVPLPERLFSWWPGSRDPFAAANPDLTVKVTTPGTPAVHSSQTFRLHISVDPLVNDEQQAETQLLGLAIAGRAGTLIVPDPVAGIDYQAGVNERLQIRLFRRREAGGLSQAGPGERIPPGVYRTRLYVDPEWGEPHVEPVEVRVRDTMVWPVLTMALGILVSILASYWQSRQPLVRARATARRLHRLYRQNGVRLELMERALLMLNGSLAAGDLPGARRASGLVASLLERLPASIGLDGILRELAAMPEVQSSRLWAEVLAAEGLADAAGRVRGYCRRHPAAAVQAMAAALEPLAPLGPPPPAVPVASPAGPAASPAAEPEPRRRVWLAALRRQGTQPPITGIPGPGLWEVLAWSGLFLLVNGSLIGLQMGQSYTPNATFGSASDYLNLLFWGFAGDSTRDKLTQLASSLMPARTPETPSPDHGKAQPGDPPDWA